MKILLATPSLDHKVHAKYLETVLIITRILEQNEIQWELSFELGNSDISLARNCLVTRFLASEADYILFIDSDIHVTAEHLKDFLLSTSLVIGGAYRKKEKEIHYTMKNLEKTEKPFIFNVSAIGTGFLKINKSIFSWLEVKEEVAEFTYRGIKMKKFFYSDVIDGVFYGEDYLFCYRVRQLGVDIRVDTKLTLKHFGDFCYE